MGAPNPDRYPPHPLDDTLITELVKDAPGWVLFLSCHECMHSSTLRPANLAVLPRPPKTWGELKSRLMCHAPCRSRQFEISFRYQGYRRN